MIENPKSIFFSIEAAIVAVVLSAPLVAADGDPSLLQPLDVFKLEWATDPQISPSGDRVAYVRNSMDEMTDKRRSRIWIIDIASGDTRPVSAAESDASWPRWSPSGDRISYLEIEDENKSLVIESSQADTKTEIAPLAGDSTAFSWSPSGDRIAFAMRVQVDRPPLALLPQGPEGSDWASPPRVIETLIYRADGEGYLQDGFFQWFVVSSSGGSPRQLTSGNHHYYDSRTHDPGRGPVWTKNGEFLIFSANLHEDWLLDPLDYDIHRLSLATGAVEPLTHRAGPETHPALSPDGHQLAYLGFEDRYQGHQKTGLTVLNLEDGTYRELGEDFDRDFQQPLWDSHSRGLFFSYETEGNGKLAFIDLDGEVRTLAGDLGGESIGRPYAGGSFSISDDDRYVYTMTTPNHPADLAVGSKATEQTRRITDLNGAWLRKKALATVEEFGFESAYDGRRIQGWIAKPAQFDPQQKYPLILEIHGGPFLNYGDRFSAEVQFFAAAGYVVVYVNPRGSTSYGEEFANLIHHNYPGQDYDDLMSGIDAVIAQGFIDPDHLYVTGGSGGGVLTAWIVGKTERFRAAVSAKPVINWYSFALTADSYNFFYKYWFPNAPWERPEVYLDRSPISLVGNVTTPTMLLVGEEDYRTPISEAEQYYQALKLRGIDTALVRMPGASHSIAKRPSQLIAKVKYILGWFDRYR
ncbi:MAG: S9 family peptidase [Acidobacteriota bacterium]